MRAILATLALLLVIPSETLRSDQNKPTRAPRSCESLTTLKLDHTSITSASRVAAGAFIPPPPPGAAGGSALPNADAMRAYRSLPSFCRVVATSRPSTDSDITIEVWLPDAAGWNGKFQAVGNGGWAGVISYGALAAGLQDGYAAASTDTGHVGGSGAFALGHPEKLADFGYRAVHELAVQSKAITDAYYGSAPKLSFWNGCSTGGRQGVTAAMRYPADFNAIVAGAPSVNQALLHAVRIYINRIVHRSADSYIPAGRHQLIHQAALQACDAQDGVKDGVIENPLRCRFDPKVLECKEGYGTDCLTSAQVETAKALYAPITNPRTGEVVAPPLLQPGTEAQWNILAGPEPLGIFADFFKYVVFKDPQWDARRFDPRTDIDRAMSDDYHVVGLADPNLKPFFDGGGKLLLYHGWADAQVPAQNTIKYFGDVVRATGSDAVGKSIQLYMVPGMGHCRGGAGVDTFDKMKAIEDWVQQGRAPESILASKVADGKAVRTRPLCPFGKVAKWNGSGSSNDAANFSCVAE